MKNTKHDWNNGTSKTITHQSPGSNWRLLKIQEQSHVEAPSMTNVNDHPLRGYDRKNGAHYL